MPWEITNVARDAAGGIERLTLREAGTAGPEYEWPKASSQAPELYKLWAKEAFDQFRYFGTLRSLVTWGVIGVVAVILVRLPPAALASFWVIGAIVVVLGLVVIVQWWFQREQKIAGNVASKAQKLLMGSAKGSARSRTYGALRKQQRRRVGYIAAPDLATVALMLLLLAAGIIALSSLPELGVEGGANAGRHYGVAAAPVSCCTIVVIPLPAAPEPIAPPTTLPPKPEPEPVAKPRSDLVCVLRTPTGVEIQRLVGRRPADDARCYEISPQ